MQLRRKHFLKRFFKLRCGDKYCIGRILHKSAAHFFLFRSCRIINDYDFPPAAAFYCKVFETLGKLGVILKHRQD